MTRDRKPRMTKNRLLLMQTIQKGIKQVRGTFIDIKQYLEPMSVKEKRRLRYEQKKKYLKEKGIKGF